MSDKKDNNILHALWRFFSGKKSEVGEEIYNQWFQSHDDSEGYLNRLDTQQRDEHRDNVFRSVQKELDQTPKPIPVLRNHPGRWTVFNRVAAILIIGGLLSLAGVYLSGVSEPEVIPIVMVEKSNPVGQISEITLPDGSTVWLSAASSIEYPENFSGGARTVTIEGEAFFDVIHDPERPFIVNSGPLSTSVLGTSFNIKAYQEDPAMEVTLATGSVEVTVQGSNQKQILEPNQRVSYKRDTGLSDISQADAILAKAWTQRELVFMREDFETIARTFERWYGVDFVFEDELLKEETFVYHFKELSLRNSMIILNELADFDYEIDNEQVVIKPSAH